MATTFEARLDSGAIVEFLRSRNGPVLRHILTLGDEVQRRARAQAGRQSGKLRASIVKRFVSTSGGPGVEIGSPLPYAAVHHEGSRPHRIVGNPLLVFFWPKVGRVVAFPHVNHPGTKPNEYLTDALRQSVR